jgi:AcrR family transcriptional regulator
MAKRRYEQRLRAKSAEETQRRIIDAVYDHLREAPAEPVSLGRVARTAGVARSTIYVIYGSRAGLFDAVADDLFRRTGYERLLEAVSNPDPRESLRGGLRSGVEMFAADRDVARALFSMEALDEEAVGGAIKRMEERRSRGMARLARRLGEKSLLRPDVSVKDAANLLWLLAGFDAFDALYTGRRMSAKAVGDLLVATAERSLYRRP